MNALRWAVPALCAALALAGCPRRLGSPTSVLDEAAQGAQQDGASARTLSFAGFHALLLDGSASQAQARFDAALKKDPAEPWAHYGELLLARRNGHPDRALDAAFALVERAPRHPLAAAAARYALEQVGTSTAQDERISEVARRALARQPPGDTAQLLRSALATISGQRLDAEAQTRALEEMGVADAWTLLGPLSAFHLLSFDEVSTPARTGVIAFGLEGPFGSLAPRALHFPDGRVSLAGEPSDGDLFVLASDFEVESPGEYLVRTVTLASHKAYLDGTLLFERRAFSRASSTVSAAGVQLAAGRHRLLLEVSNDGGNAGLTASVLRADGGPSHLRFTPASGAALNWKGAKVLPIETAWATAESYERTLEPEAGAALARFVAIRDGQGRDPDGAERLMDALFAELPATPALLTLRAELSLSDRTLPSRVGRARATRDLEAALEKDKANVHALLARARLALDDGRQAEAAELVKRARAAATPAGYPVPLLRSRVELAMGIDAQAEQSAKEALSLQPGLCDALQLRYDLARKRDAVQLADELVKVQEGCPGSHTRLAEHARIRGNTREAIALYSELLKRDPSNLGTAIGLSSLLRAAQRYPEAVKLLQGERALWPRSPELPRKLADLYEFWGRPDKALAAREEALRLSGGDLALRRALHREKTGKELLAEYAVDGKEAIRRYEAQPGTEGATSALVLDFAAVEAFADGSQVDRIHVIQKALAQAGVSDIGEVSLPPGAAVLTLRTLKQDGTVLEPEDIQGKETISLPGVQVGDYTEYEYLQAHAPRGPAQPGFSAAIFYYRVAGVPNAWSTYTVIAPRALGMEVDAHNVKSAPPRLEDGRSVYRHEETHVPPYIPEPNAPPSANEYLPWVQLGAGAHGNDGLAALYADAFLDRGRITHEVDSFARKAVAGAQGLDAVRALHSAVMQKLQGRDAGLTVSAASSLAQDRGSRLWALKASLEAVGIKTRVALVRTFSADPSPYLFPNPELLPYLALRAELPDEKTVWLDTAVRFGPFGKLPEQARNCDAVLLPEPGRPLEKVRTPAGEPEEGKRVTLDLQLTEDGELRGHGEERYTGFDAAQLTTWLEQLPPDQRKQALQSALARYFGGAEMQKLELSLANAVGQDLVMAYEFRVPHFARAEGRERVLDSITFPAEPGRRFVQLAARTTPLFIDSTERTVTKVTLKVPKGFTLEAPLNQVKLQSDFGAFFRNEQLQGDTLLIDEDYRLQMARVPPDRYEDFARFAGQVDLLQARQLVLKMP